MESLKEIFHFLIRLDVEGLITWACNNGVAYTVLTIIIFSETGLLIGFFLPGDSLLVTAGIFAYRGDMDILILNLLLIPAAVIGDAVGYWIGHKSGPHLFKKEQSFFFRKDYLIKTHQFYEKHGGITIVLARFMPIIRTFAPTVAGIAQMRYKDFFKYNVFGGIFWVLGMTFIGYFLGQIFPQAVKKIEYIIVIVVFLSILPAIVKYFHNKLKKNKSVI